MNEKDTLSEILINAVDYRSLGTLRRSLVSLSLVSRLWRDVLRSGYCVHAIEKRFGIFYRDPFRIIFTNYMNFSPWKDFQLIRNDFLAVQENIFIEDKIILFKCGRRCSYSRTDNLLAILLEDKFYLYMNTDSGISLIYQFSTLTLGEKIERMCDMNIFETTIGIILCISYYVKHELYYLSSKGITFYIEIYTGNSMPPVIYDGYIYRNEESYCFKFFATGKSYSLPLEISEFQTTRHSIICSLAEDNETIIIDPYLLENIPPSYPIIKDKKINIKDINTQVYNDNIIYRGKIYDPLTGDLIYRIPLNDGEYVIHSEIHMRRYLIKCIRN